MESVKYLEERLNSQQKWYSHKSGINKQYYNWLKISTIIVSVMIPFIAGFDEKLSFLNVSTRIVIGFLGAIVAVLTAISGLMKFKEKWINYRSASERLKRERFLWATKTLPYNTDDAFNLLVKRVEAIISTENGDWTSYIGEEELDTN